MRIVIYPPAAPVLYSPLFPNWNPAMCVSFPIPPEYRGGGRQAGPLKLFLGAVVFLAIMLFTLWSNAWRRV